MELAKAGKLARELMEENGLGYPRWNFDWDNAQRRFGICVVRKMFGEVSGTIRLSMPLTQMNSRKEVQNTILHEIAHAQVAIKYGKGGHGREWKREARALGIKPERCYSADSTKIPPPLYEAVCAQGHKSTRMRLPKLRKYSCGTCSPVFSEAFLLTYKKNPRSK